MCATLTAPAVERRDPSRPADLPALREALAAHLEAKPRSPQPYEPHSNEGWDYYKKRCTWSDKLRRLEHEIWKLEHPPLKFVRVQPSVAYRQASPRLRQ